MKGIFTGMRSSIIISASSQASFGIKVLTLAALTVAAFAEPQAAHATVTTRYAKPGGMTTGLCDTWGNACTLHYALGVAASGDQVWVKEGVHTPGSLQSDYFLVPPGVAVYGGFAGTETLLTERNSTTHLTILSGDIGDDDTNTDGNHIDETTADIQGSNSYLVVGIVGTTTPVTSSTVLDGFTITGGDGSTGGGLDCVGTGAGHECSPTLSNLVFSGNRATWGGGLVDEGTSGGVSSPTLTNVTFQGNSSTNQGGAMYNDGQTGGTSSPSLTNVTFSNNSSSVGAAIFNLGSNGGVASPTLSHVTFTDNQASSLGGGMYNDGASSGTSSPTLNMVTFGNNSAQFGGAMYNDGQTGGTSSPSLTNVTFNGNHVSVSGGAMYNNGVSGTSSPLLIGVTFSNNSASNSGGAIYNNGENSSGTSSPGLTNVTFSGNHADGLGGAMFDDGYAGHSNPILQNVTFNANSANYGGAFYNDGSNSGQSTPALTDVILWGNTAGADGPEIYNFNATPTVDHSIVQGSHGSGGAWDTTLGSDHGGNLDKNPKLNPLGSYGGPTKTMTLQKGSPAIDTGTMAADAADGSCPGTDQRGIHRPQDGDGNGTKVCDMGATESRFVTATLRSAGSYDGWTLESGENTSVGGSMNSSATTFNLGDNAANKQYRSILSFNTTMPSNAAIISVTLKFRKAGLIGTNPFSTLGNIVVDMRKGPFSGASALQTGDFQAAASKPAAMAVTNAPSGTGWYSKALAAANFGFINKAGVTQLRLRFGVDDNNNLAADYLTFYSGNAAAANRPALAIKYYAP